MRPGRLISPYRRRHVSSPNHLADYNETLPNAKVVGQFRTRQNADTMRILFIHKFMAGQFRHLIHRLSQSSRHQVACLGQVIGPETLGIDANRVKVLKYQSVDDKYGGGGFGTRFRQDLIRAGEVAERLVRMRTEGFVPDIILSHSGWGESLFCKEIFPDSPLIGYFEHFYRPQGGGSDFFPEYPLSLEARCLIRTFNAGQLLNLTDCDAGVSPTAWQRNGFPRELRGKIQQIHEGVDPEDFKPSSAVTFTLKNGKRLTRDDEVVTYVSRSLEPFRGFPQFLEAMDILLKRRPRLQVLVAGGDDATYSPPLPDGRSYREQLCSDLDLDPSRIHFLGWLQGADYRRLLQVSSAHVYLTPPFVLSWSMLEAMASGCVVVGSNTAPVQEVIQHGENGLLCDFFAPQQLADTVESVLDHPARMRGLGDRARDHIVRHYNVNESIARYCRLIGRLTGIAVHSENMQ